jgi:hypothetical protein
MNLFGNYFVVNATDAFGLQSGIGLNPYQEVYTDETTTIVEYIPDGVIGWGGIIRLGPITRGGIESPWLRPQPTFPAPIFRPGVPILPRIIPNEPPPIPPPFKPTPRLRPKPKLKPNLPPYGPPIPDWMKCEEEPPEPTCNCCDMTLEPGHQFSIWTNCRRTPVSKALQNNKLPNWALL